jgi:mono/diheme cytochrome c family protein
MRTLWQGDRCRLIEKIVPAIFILMLVACQADEQPLATPVLDLATPTAAEGGDATPESGESTEQGQGDGEAAPATPTPLDDLQLTSIGKGVYLENCASCHQPNGEGTAVYPALNNNPVILAEDPAPAIALILHGRAQMPAFQEVLSAEQIAAVLSYTRQAWENTASTVTVAQTLAWGAAPAAGSPRMTAIPTATSALTVTGTITPGGTE